ncbi:MAG: hypothetical protein R6W90_10070 [Ignavibacteriaceae bacterium]
MKVFYTFLVFLIFTGINRADDDKYTSEIKKNIALADSAAGTDVFLKTAESFERIAFAEKDKWLPYYYASYFYILTGFSDTAAEKKDNYFDKADAFIKTADSLQPDESEIYALKGMISQGKMSVDPMNRYMEYYNKSLDDFGKAIELDTLNPRPEYLIGISIFYTPEQYGGGPAVAKPYLENSLMKYKAFVPENELMPIWGRPMVEGVLSQIK